MAGASGQGSSDGTLSSGNNEGEDDDDITYANPRLSGSHLTVTWPIRSPVSSMVGKCTTKLKSDNKYTIVNSLVKHLRDIHKVKVDKKTNWCGVCHTNIGRCPQPTPASSHVTWSFKPILIAILFVRSVMNLTLHGALLATIIKSILRIRFNANAKLKITCLSLIKIRK